MRAEARKQEERERWKNCMEEQRREDEREGENTNGNKGIAEEGDEVIRKEIKSLSVGDRIDSDYLPFTVVVKRERDREKGGGKKGVKKERRVWDEEGRREFKELMEKEGLEKGEARQMLEVVERRVQEVVNNIREKGGKKGGGHR
ncbi:hypothetical protein KM043_017609 [Ampulex compressa]|nr:hypothetical protein KM043_017609 [Ampulex compressa]